MYKKLLVALLPLCLVVSCDKEEKTACYSCISKVTVSVVNYPSSTSSTTTKYCDKTEAEAADIAKQGTHTTVTTSGGVTTNTIIKTTCTKQ